MNMKICDKDLGAEITRRIKNLFNAVDSRKSFYEEIDLEGKKYSHWFTFWFFNDNPNKMVIKHEWEKMDDWGSPIERELFTYSKTRDRFSVWGRHEKYVYNVVPFQIEKGFKPDRLLVQLDLLTMKYI